MNNRRIDWTIVALLAVAIVATLCAATVPNWIRYLGQVSISTALASVGVMMLLRAGLLSFGQGLFYFVGGYAVALLNRYGGITDAFAVVLVAAVAAGLLAVVLGLLLAGYRGIFFSMLTLAVSMVMFWSRSDCSASIKLAHSNGTPRLAATCCSCSSLPSGNEPVSLNNLPTNVDLP